MKKNNEELNKNKISKEYLEKIKENNKLFDEKMNSLNKKKIKVIKPKQKKITKTKNSPILSIKKEIQFNYKKQKSNKFINYIINNEHQMTTINNNKAKD